MTLTIEYGYKNYGKQKANIQIWDTDENEIKIRGKNINVSQPLSSIYFNIDTSSNTIVVWNNTIVNNYKILKTDTGFSLSKITNGDDIEIKEDIEETLLTVYKVETINEDNYTVEEETFNYGSLITNVFTVTDGVFHNYGTIQITSNSKDLVDIVSADISTDTNTGSGTDTNTGSGTDTNTGDSTDTNTGGSTDTNTGSSTDTNTGSSTDTNTGSGTEGIVSNISYVITVVNSGTGAYNLSGTDRTGSISGNNATVRLNINDTITFTINASGHPFNIRNNFNGSHVSNASGQGTIIGDVIWTPTTGGTYYYQCSFHPAMNGQIIVN